MPALPCQYPLLPLQWCHTRHRDAVSKERARHGSQTRILLTENIGKDASYRVALDEKTWYLLHDGSNTSICNLLYCWVMWTLRERIRKLKNIHWREKSKQERMQIWKVGKWTRTRSALCSALLRAEMGIVLWSLIILAALLTLSAQLLEVFQRIAVTR